MAHLDQTLDRDRGLQVAEGLGLLTNSQAAPGVGPNCIKENSAQFFLIVRPGAECVTIITGLIYVTGRRARKFRRMWPMWKGLVWTGPLLGTVEVRLCLP